MIKEKKITAADVKLNFGKEAVSINQSESKTYLIYDYPGELAPGFLYGLQHASFVGDKRSGRTDISVSTIIRPKELFFNMTRKMQMDRLQREISDSDDGKASTYSDPTKIAALETLMELRSGRANFVEVYFLVTIASENKKAQKIACKAFERSLKQFGSASSFKFKELKHQQKLGLEATTITGSADKLLEKYKGRVMGVDSLAAFYPFVSGNFSDEEGIYLGHRVDSALSVNIGFKKSADAQNMLVTGATGEGKSAFIKGLILGLLIAGYKIYIYDLDGEYEEICKAYGGLWLDLTGEDAPFVDPTIITTELMKDVKDASKYTEDDLEKINDVDSKRYKDAASETIAQLSMICEKELWLKNKSVENAAQLSLIQMWEDEDVHKNKYESWNNGSPSFKKLYEKISANAEDETFRFREGAKLLANELWSYFDGLDDATFKTSIDSNYFKGYQLTVIRTMSAGENPSPKDKRNATLKFNMASTMVWNQIKRDRLLKQIVSCEIFDEFQRAGNDESVYRTVYRGITTSRKFNSMVVLGFNDPSILFAKRKDAEGNETSNKGLWTNTRHLVAFRLPKDTVDSISKDAEMPDEVVKAWLNLPKYSFVFRTTLGNNKMAYDILKMQLPEEELNLSKTREFVAA